jgi:predicted nucleic acid-binding protein
MDQRRTSVVVDASAALAGLLPGEESMAVPELYAPAIVWIVPGSFGLELLNAFVISARRGRISGHDAETLVRQIRELPLAIDSFTVESAMEVVGLATRHRLTAYDAAYLELAIRMSAPIATLDADLVRAAMIEQVTVISPRN